MKTTVIYFSIFYSLSIHVESRPQLFASGVKTERPIIGILAQNTDEYMNKTFGRTYIVASYIKYIESAGGRVVPIRDVYLAKCEGRDSLSTLGLRNDLNEKQLKNLFDSINGVLFPGGGVNIYDSPYARTGKILFKLAVEANDAQDVFPLWGTCLGFQFLSVCGAGGENVISSVDGENYSVPLNLSEGYQFSKLFGSAPEEIITYLKTQNVTFNHHHECISTDTYFSNKALNKFYRLLSTNKDKEGKKKFVSTIEAYDYPFFGVQWHPEKNPFEWTSLEAINHSKKAVLVTQYVANFFVNQARLSAHRFPTKEEEDDALIYKHSPVYCFPEKTNFEQCYIF